VTASVTPVVLADMVIDAITYVCFVFRLVAFVTTAVQAAVAVAGAAALGAGKIWTYLNYDGANSDQLLW
jgi:hypothetical protein